MGFTNLLLVIVDGTLVFDCSVGRAWKIHFHFFKKIPYEIKKFIFLECHKFAQQKFSGKYENFFLSLSHKLKQVS